MKGQDFESYVVRQVLAMNTFIKETSFKIEMLIYKLDHFPLDLREAHSVLRYLILPTSLR